jgi:HSP20 family protein
MIDRYDPFVGRALGLRQVMDRLFEDAFVMPRGTDGQNWGGPPMNVFEEDDNLVVEAQVPGFSPDDIEVNVEQGVLTISGQTEAEEERKERNYLIREQRTGRFTRSLRLPATYTADACNAQFHQGVLRLEFPKAEEAKPRRISIGANGQRAVTASSEGKSEPVKGR